MSLGVVSKGVGMRMKRVLGIVGKAARGLERDERLEELLVGDAEEEERGKTLLEDKS